MGSSLSSRVGDVYEALRAGLVERDEPLRLALLAALSGEHFLLVGPPGTAKSTLARRLHLAFRGRYFERLLTRFTVPEELFGPLSLRGLERDVYERLTDGYLPTASIAFLDEIFKANSAILNALLGILNERVMDQGPRRDAVPLVCLIGASNELPTTEELGALSDRFILRYEVGPVSREAFGALLDADEAPPIFDDATALSDADLAAFRAAAKAVVVHPWVRELLGDLRERLAKEGHYVSDRRLRKSVSVLRMAAVMEGREAVGLQEISLLHHCLWQRIEERPVVAKALRAVMLETFLAEPERYTSLVETLERTLEAERSAEVDLQDMRGALFVDAGGHDTHSSVRRIQKTTASGEPLYISPPAVARYACTRAQLAEHYSGIALDRYVGDPKHWFVEEIPMKARTARKRYRSDHVSMRVEQVARIGAHLDELLGGLATLLDGATATTGVEVEVRAVEAELAGLRGRLAKLGRGFSALPTHEPEAATGGDVP